MIGRMRHISILAAAGLLAACSPEPGTMSDQSATDDSSYEILIRGDPPLVLAASCSGCHSRQTSEAIPSLAGRTADDLKSSFEFYKSDTEGTTVMHRIARGYSDEDIQKIANYLAERTP